MTTVVDASVACKWFIRETHSEEAEALLAEGESLIAPDLLVPEICNVGCLKLRRKEITFEQASAMVAGVRLFVDAFTPSIELSSRALVIADKLAHPAYDCFYLALAELRDCRLATADRRLVQRLSGTEWSKRIMGIGFQGGAEG